MTPETVFAQRGHICVSCFTVILLLEVQRVMVEALLLQCYAFGAQITCVMARRMQHRRKYPSQALFNDLPCSPAFTDMFLISLTQSARSCHRLMKHSFTFLAKSAMGDMQALPWHWHWHGMRVSHAPVMADGWMMAARPCKDPMSY